MGTFSIWHWIIVWHIVLIVFLGTVIPIVSANKDKTLARLPYFYRILALFVAGLVFFVTGLVLGILSEWPDILGVGLIILTVCLALVMWVLLFLWSVYRAQDIGWSKWWTLLFTVPGANLYLLVILLWPGRKIEEQQELTSWIFSPMT